MRLRRLRLENFRQHIDTDIEFADGMTAIVGPNGSGKSTLLEAIGYALYAENRANKDQISSYWQESKKFLVSLEIDLEERHYRIWRTESKAGLEELVGGQWEERAEGPRAVTQASEKLLGLNYQQFTNSFCALQKELEFLKLSAASRRDEIAKMLGYDSLRIAEERAKTRASSYRTELAGATANSPVDAESLNREFVAKTQQITELGEKLTQAQSSVSAAEVELPRLTTLAANARLYVALAGDLRELKATGQALQKRQEEARARFASLETESKELEKLAPAAKEYEALELEIRKHEAAQAQAQGQLQAETRRKVEIEQLERRLQELSAPALSAAQEELKEATEKLAEHARALADKRRQLQELQGEVAGLRAAATAAAKKLKHSEELLAAGKCPECGQPFTGDFQTRLDSERKECVAAEFNAKSSEQALAQVNKDLDQLLVVQLEAPVRLAEARVSAAEEAAKLNQQLTALQSKPVSLDSLPNYDADAHHRAKEKASELKPAFLQFQNYARVQDQLAKTQSDLSTAQAEFETAKAEAKRIGAEMEELGFESAAQANNCIADEAALLQKIESLKPQVVEQTRALDRAKTELESIENRKLRLKELESRKQFLESQATLYAEAQKQLKLLRESLNRQLQPLIKDRAERILSDLTGARYTALELDERFEAAIVEDGRPKAVISGGEEDVLALSLRLALSQLIQERQGRPMGLLILDEVFGSLDHDRRDSVLECLENLKGMAGSFGQILAISHIFEINQVADQCLYVSLDVTTHRTTVSDQPTGADLILPESLKTGLFDQEPVS